MLALAYPDRLAQARGDGRFRLRTGAAAALPRATRSTGEAFLVVADLERRRRAPTGAGDDDLRIRLAAGLDEADVEAAAGGAIERGRDAGAGTPTATTCAGAPSAASARWCWRRAEAERRPGAATDRRARRPGARHPARACCGGATSTATLQARLGFARPRVRRRLARRLRRRARSRRSTSGWRPGCAGATGRADLERIDVGRVLRDLVGHHRVPELDRLRAHRGGRGQRPTGPVDYAGEQPAIAVRVQDLFGTTVHPAVADGRVPLVVHLLSPAGRPVQVTADLPGFWAGSWSEVRKDMAGRYPKHDWPLDPATASPSRRGHGDLGDGTTR